MKVDEIFGPTLQGEGAMAGAWTMFVRLGGCDFRCSWCDTLHAVDPAYAKRWIEMTPGEVLADVEAKAAHLPPGAWVTISGGNPAIWQRELPELVAALQGRGWRVAIETQGSVVNEAFREADMVVFSPKPPSSKMPMDWDRLAVGMVMAQARAVLKVVIFDDADLAFAKEVHARHPFAPFFAQPGTAQSWPIQQQIIERLRWLSDKVLQDVGCIGWRVIPQLHALAWGGERGR